MSNKNSKIKSASLALIASLLVSTSLNAACSGGSGGGNCVGGNNETVLITGAQSTVQGTAVETGVTVNVGDGAGTSGDLDTSATVSSNAINLGNNATVNIASDSSVDSGSTAILLNGGTSTVNNAGYVSSSDVNNPNGSIIEVDGGNNTPNILVDNTGTIEALEAGQDIAAGVHVHDLSGNGSVVINSGEITLDNLETDTHSAAIMVDNISDTNVEINVTNALIVNADNNVGSGNQKISGINSSDVDNATVIIDATIDVTTDGMVEDTYGVNVGGVSNNGIANVTNNSTVTAATAVTYTGASGAQLVGIGVCAGTCGGSTSEIGTTANITNSNGATVNVINNGDAVANDLTINGINANTFDNATITNDGIINAINNDTATGGAAMVVNNSNNAMMVNNHNINVTNNSSVRDGLGGMSLNNSSGAVINNGTITSTNNGTGIVGGANIANSANLGSTFHNTSTGVINTTGATTIGFGSIMSGESAPLMTPNLINDGSITGEQGIVFWNLSAFTGGDVMNNYLQNNGTITGTGGVAISGNSPFFPADGQEHVENFGTINGNIELGNGDDIVDWRSGSISGDIIMGDSGALNGNNLLNIYAGVTDDITQLLDGGDDIDTADGLIDILTFDGYVGTVTDVSNIQNWENIALDNSANVNVGDGTLAVDMLDIINGSSLNLGTTFILDANSAINIGTGSELATTGAGLGVYEINTPLLTNNGALSTQDGVAGDVLTINGDYEGGGSLLIDANLGVAATVDTITINGDVIGGTTTVDINDVTTGTPAATAGLEIINVTGATAEGDFEGSITAGQFQYDLELVGDTSWSLISSLAPVTDIPQYASMISGSSLAGHQILSTMRERIGEIREISVHGVEQPHDYQAWVKAYHDQYDIDNGAASFESKTNSLTIGVDKRLFRDDNSDSVFLAGFSLGMSDTNLDLDNGANGEIDGFSGSLYGTYHNDKHDFYVDAVLSASDMDYSYTNDLKSDKAEFSGRSYGASLEVGKRLKLMENLYLEPQARLAYQKIKTEGFKDAHGDVYKAASNESIKGSVGVRLERPIKTKNMNFVPHVRFHVVEEFGDDYTLSSAQNVTSKSFDRTYEAGIGATLQINDGFSAYANAEYETNDFGSNDPDHFEGVNFTVGLKFNF